MSTQEQIREIYNQIRLRLAPEHSDIVQQVADMVKLGREREALALMIALSMTVEYGHMLYRDPQFVPDYYWLNRSSPEAVRTALLQMLAEVIEYQLPQAQQREILKQVMDLATRGPYWVKRAWLLLHGLYISIIHNLPAPQPLPNLDVLPEAKAQKDVEAKERAQKIANSVSGLTTLVSTIKNSAFDYWLAGNMYRKLTR